MGYASSGNPPLKKYLTKIIKFVIIVIENKKGGKYYERNFICSTFKR